MKLVSFNVNGLRAVLNKGFAEHFAAFGADVVCLQEIKALEGQADFHPEGYLEIYNSAEKKGYSGTLTLTRVRPLSIAFGIDGRHTNEGRVITAEYEHFYLVNCYSPNAQDGLRRIGYRLEFERDLADYLAALDSKKPVVLCGDLNVAHEEIDLARPAQNRGNPGFPTRRGGRFPRFCRAAFSTVSARFIPRAATPTAGGASARVPERTTSAGASTTSSSASGFWTSSPRRRSCPT